jgi:alkyl hydroperoxide reductase subunit AhpC
MLHRTIHICTACIREIFMLTVGDKLPASPFPSSRARALPAGETLDLGQTNGKWKILFYWPKDFTFVCPTEIVGYGELKGFRRPRRRADRRLDRHRHVHHAWRKSDERLAAADFPWIADNKKELANALGILAPDEGVAYRATFIIDPDNVIQHVTVNGLNVGRNPQETLRVLDALQTDELCPCNWHEGEEVLRPAA